MIASLFATLMVVAGMLVAARLIRTPEPAKPSVVRGEPYECGEIPTGGSWRVMPVGFAAFTWIQHIVARPAPRRRPGRTNR